MTITFPNVILTATILIFTIIAIIKSAFSNNKTLPCKINTTCPECKKEFNHFITRKKSIIPNEKVLFVTNIILATIMLIINAINISDIILDNNNKEFILQILNKNLSENFYYDFQDALFNLLLITTQIILLIINSKLNKSKGKKEIDTIIAICNNCGQITEFENDYEEKE